MGLFINDQGNPGIFKNGEKINEPNQAYSRKDFLTDLLKEQHDANLTLKKALEDLKREYHHQETAQAKQWNQIGSELGALKESNLQHEQLEFALMERFNAFEENMAQKLASQADFQTDVLTRLDNQEALTEKIYRQLNHIRSIIFERTNYLAAKVEEGYKITSSYIYKLMTGAEQPLTFFLLNQKKEENQQHKD